MASTPAITAAERAGIPFSLHEYERDPRSASYGDEAAEKLDVEPERLFKTLIVTVDGELAVACVPVPSQLDLKALGKRAQLADKGHAQKVTGYVSGGASPLGRASGYRPTSTPLRSSTRRFSSTAAGAACSSSSTHATSSGYRCARAPDSVLHVTATTPVELHVVSDATGETAARLVQALEAQFPDQEFVEIRHPRVESEEDLHLAVNRMKGRPAVVIYTIVQPELRDAMRTLCRRTKLHYCDLLGHPIEAVARVSGMAARMTPGSRPPLNSAYFKRMEAIEFAVRFDDGVGRGLDDADIVLVGVSRTSKTPLSIYLGYLGHKVANVPVVKGIAPPPGLFEIDQRKIVGLTINADRLSEIRRARARTMGARSRQYAELREVYDELEVAEKLHRRLGCPVIDISELSIEETAHRVLRVVEERQST